MNGSALRFSVIRAEADEAGGDIIGTNDGDEPEGNE